MLIFDYDEAVDDPLQPDGTGILAITGPAGEEATIEQSAHSVYPDCKSFCERMCHRKSG